jgi:hypothetical protein
MNNPRNFVLLPIALAIVASAQAQSIRLTAPETFDADGTILISGRIGWTKTNHNGFSTGQLKLIDWSAYTGVNYNYRLDVQEWFVPVFDKNMVYEGPIAKIRFTGDRGTTYPVDARIGIGFHQSTYGGQEHYYLSSSIYARVNTNPNPPPVPEPATLIALSAGLVALVRKRRS